MTDNPVVLSLFNGMSCGNIALQELGIIPKIYYSSEIDKFAIAQTQLNFSNTIQIGSVVDVDVSKLKRIDLVMGGSPCQSFSFAGKRKGMSTKDEIQIYTLEKYLELKEQGFEFEGQSYLFWEYMRILTDIRKYNPDVIFLLENVEMGKHWERILSEAIGIYAVHINSALVCAQNRRRIYFTNIRTRQEGLFGELHSDIPQPKDRGILLKDILESDVDEKYYLSDKMLNSITYQDKGNGEVANLNKGGERGSVYKPDCKMSTIAATDYKQPKQIIEGLKPFGTSQDQKVSPVNGKSQTMSCGHYNQSKIIEEFISVEGKAPTQRSSTGRAIDKKHNYQFSKEPVCVAMRGRNPDNPSDRTTGSPTEQRLEPNLSGKTNCLTSVQKDNLVCHNMMPRSSKTGKGGTAHLSRDDGKTYCLDTGSTNAIETRQRIRRLTPTECSRLQGIPDWYKWECSDSQIYKMCGNGWQIDTIEWICSFIKIEKI